MLLGRQSITATNRAVGSRGSDGRWTDGTATNATISDATVRPANGKELQLLEEGYRHREVKVVYTATEPLIGNQHTGRKGTVYTIGGLSYLVVQVEPHRSGIISHWKAYAVRVQEAD